MAALLMLLLAAAGAEEQSMALVTEGASAYVYADPSPASASLAVLRAGDWVEIEGQHGAYTAVRTPEGLRGYVLKSLLHPVEIRTALIGTVTIPGSSGTLNLRSEPSYDAEVIGRYPTGVPCLVYSTVDGWCSVQVDGVSGYFRREFLVLATRPASTQLATVVTPGNTPLNLREGPSTGYEVSVQLSGGAYMMVLAEGRDWWMVECGGRTGFVNASFVQRGIHGAGADDIALRSAGTAVVTNPQSTQVLNLRQEPNTDSISLGQYANGTVFTVLAQGIEWCKVRSSSGTVGYMMTDYLRLQGLPDVPTLTVSQPQHTYVNLRSMASATWGRVLQRVPDGEKVHVLIPGDSWVKVRWRGQTGYMAAYLLK